MIDCVILGARMSPPQPRPSAALLAAGLALLWSPQVGASDRVVLTWEGPDSCPVAQFLVLLQRHLDDRPGPALGVQVRVRERAAGRWKLDLDIITEHTRSTRELVGEDCVTLADAAAFIVAQALAHIDAAPASVLVPEAPASSEVTAPSPDPISPISPISVPEPDLSAPPARPLSGPPRVRSLRGAVRLGAGLRAGAVPGVSPGLAAAIGLLGERWRVDLIGRGDLPTRTRSIVAPAVGASFGLWAVGVRGCLVPGRKRLEFPLCLGTEFGQVIGRSLGLTNNGRAALVWAAATAGPGLMWSPRPWVALVVQAELAVALVRHDFLIRGLPPLASVGPIQAGGSLALEFRYGGRVQ